MCLHCEILGEGSSSRELECLNDSLYPPWAVMQARDKPPLYLENDIGVSCIPGYVLQLSSLSHSSFIANLRRTRAPLYGCASVLMRDPHYTVQRFHDAATVQFSFTGCRRPARCPVSDSLLCSLSKAHPNLRFHFPHGAEGTWRISKVPVGCPSVIIKPLVCADVQL